MKLLKCNVSQQFDIRSNVPNSSAMYTSIQVLLETLLVYVHLCEKEMAHHLKVLMALYASAPRIVGCGKTNLSKPGEGTA
jgi:hypothetical protein